MLYLEHLGKSGDWNVETEGMRVFAMLGGYGILLGSIRNPVADGMEAMK
jgi:hypothetical protein